MGKRVGVVRGRSILVAMQLWPAVVLSSIKVDTNPTLHRSAAACCLRSNCFINRSSLLISHPHHSTPSESAFVMESHT